MNKKQILVVEDESIVAMELHTRLQDLGYAVMDTCKSGEQALKAVRNEHLDLVLMDIMLRGEMDGIETAKQIKQMANVPVIFLTAYADVSTLDRAKQAEPYGYLIKPFQERELRSTIEMALYKHAIEYELEETKQ